MQKIDEVSIKSNRNRIEIQKIYPNVPKDQVILTPQNAILGVSIQHPASMGNKAAAIFNFLHKNNLTDINLFVGDSLYRLTAMIKFQCSEEEGRKLGLQEARTLKNDYLAHIKENNLSYKLNYFCASELENEAEFAPRCQRLWSLYETNKNFRDVVLNFSNAYLSRLFSDADKTAMEIDICTKNSCRYLIEELAMLSILNQRGLNKFLYPGSMQAISDIITMDFPYVSDLFKNYCFISLRISRSKKRV